ncbi:hypothetical protein ACFFTQ_12860 [Streptomyces roseofulvus]|uniref:hypothetical protein n=1 Tax=Streptomyces roseofulvus TaxID=33902 RepID=UPI0031FBA507
MADAALTALALGRPRKDVAALLRMSANHVHDYAREHQAEIMARRAEILGGLHGRVLDAAMEGAELLHRAATAGDVPASERLTLARTGALVIDTVLKLKAGTDTDARLAALEARYPALRSAAGMPEIGSSEGSG